MAYRQQYDDSPQSRRPQQQQQQQQYYNPGPLQGRQQAGYDNRYDQPQQQQQQQQYDYGYDQGGYEQWDNNYYDDGYDYGNSYGYVQPQVAPNQVNAQVRPPQQPRGRGPPPRQQQQAQYAQEQAYDDRYQQSPQQGPNTRRPAGRANGPPPNAQQLRGGSRPPGLDRSLLAPTSPKRLPQDNPFPTFPTKGDSKPARAAPADSMDQAMALMTMNDNEVQGERPQQRDPPVRGQPMPVQNRPPPSGRPQGNARQDSGQFESHGYSQQRPPPNRMPSGQRPPPNMNGGRGQPQPRQGPGMQRAATMPQNMGIGAHEMAYVGQQQWDQPGATDDFRLPPSTNVPPRPSTAGGTRPGPSRQPEERPPMPHAPVQQQYQPEQQYQEAYQRDPHASLDNFYDDYYDEGDDRKSIASTIDMPNFDAIPETNNRHRRGDSIDNHLSPTSFANAPAPNNSFQQQPSRSRSHADLRGQYGNGVHEMASDAPPIPALPRANTGFAGPGGLPNGPRARGPPNRGMATDGYGPVQPPDFDPRYGQQAPPFGQRGYSDDSAHSEPPLNMMRNGPPMAGNPIPRPGTTVPVPGRMPSDPMGRRPATTQPPRNPDALPAHPVPVRSGLIPQGQPQQMGQNARPPPVRQYNGESRASLESQHSIAQRSVAQRPSSAPHPVTHDELNRLRRVWKDNPTDQATGLKLAKKLIEASQVLADENGTADTKTRNKNKEKFVNEGYKIVKKLAQVQYGDAMFYLADCYGQGLLGLQVDTKEAFTLYQGAAKAGHAASAYRTAVCCEMGHEEGGGTKRDPLKAVQWYRRAAALGDTPAMYKMGMILLKGLLGQPKNQGEAINMLQRAASNADKDNPHALHELALIYEAPQTSNERVIPDEAYALELFLQAANLGYKFSQFRLGQAYEYGLLGCPIDPRASIGWYTKSAAQEEHQSELALSGWYLTGIEGVLQQSDTEAYLWARKAACAEPPLPKALFAMGYFTEVGIGCPRSLDEAKRWYGRAAAYKFPKAQERLEELKRGGSKAQMKRERLSRTDQKQQEENCTVM